MADSKISALTDGTTPATTDAFPAARSGGTTVKLTWAELLVALPIVTIADTLLGSDTANFTFSSIPATYKHLQLIIQARTDEAVVSSVLYLQFNGDTAAHYDYESVLIANSVMTAAGNPAITACAIGEIAGASATATVAGQCIATIANYAATTFEKTILSQASTLSTQGTIASYKADTFGGLWRSTAAINAIKLIPGSGTVFKAGSRATLYGLT